MHIFNNFKVYIYKKFSKKKKKYLNKKKRIILI